MLSDKFGHFQTLFDACRCSQMISGSFWCFFILLDTFEGFWTLFIHFWIRLEAFRLFWKLMTQQTLSDAFGRFGEFRRISDASGRLQMLSDAFRRFQSLWDALGRCWTCSENWTLMGEGLNLFSMISKKCFQVRLKGWQSDMGRGWSSTGWGLSCTDWSWSWTQD